MLHRTSAAVLVAVATVSFLHPDPAWSQDDVLRRPVVLQREGGAGTEVQRDLVYKREGQVELHMDVYLPRDRRSNSRLPAVIFIHGGPVPSTLPGGGKSIAQYTSYGELIAASGLAAVTFSHRFTSVGALSTAAGDVDAAIRYVRERSEALSIDSDQICVWAISAGGVFVAPMLRARPSWLRCVLLYYAVLDPTSLEELGLTGLAEDLASTLSVVGSLSPADAHYPRILIARAGRDYPPINNGIDRFIGVAVSADVSLDVLTHPTGRHAFDVLDNDARSREIVRRSFEFIKSSIAER